ncbi:ribonuclease E inhibitor RraB [Dyella mobilis]|uniref:Ribonuclease E inhibitor RraB n=1 Tax=Dyella mobilis TaxID=1849582 RepID=A0ABS2KE55_9GAMM|nr:ribonuclease E inhibitor RraB [Dyella mobilis]MBM7129374.1 ribonuclease E inhibitor RraB [Dyella mobilis]GLQ98668.1 hypothetical protein GCM10007863_30880 [Dyella mobilis]
MSVVQQLMEVAASDTDVLRSPDRNGDDFNISREVDFLFRVETKEKAEIVAGFINDYQYGTAIAQGDNGQHSVSVKIHMPVQQNIVLSVCGFMECIAQIFGAMYDGWGCNAQRR